MVLKEYPYAASVPTLQGLELPHHLLSDYATCYRIMQAASKNYSAASRMLPTDKLPHVTALYALMRVGDDRVDMDHGGFTSPLAAIQDWRDSYWSAFETGRSEHPVLRAYLHTAHVFAIAPQLLQPYFRAMIEDLTITRFPTFHDLLHYMDGSAIPVGRVMTHILGARTPHITDAYPAADALAIAMQLSNFWRDIGEDWDRGRVYLPQEDLQSFGVTEDDLAARRIDQGFIDLIEFEIDRTETYYDQARGGVMLLKSGRWAVMSALEFYNAILPGIQRNNYDVFNRRAGTSKLRKIGLIARAWRQVRRGDWNSKTAGTHR